MIASLGCGVIRLGTLRPQRNNVANMIESKP